MKKDKISFPMCELLFFSLSLFQWGKIQSHNSVFMGGGKNTKLYNAWIYANEGEGKKNSLVPPEAESDGQQGKIVCWEDRKEKQLRADLFFFFTHDGSFAYSK